MQEYRLDREQLYAWGIRVTAIRSAILTKAKTFMEQVDIQGLQQQPSNKLCGLSLSTRKTNPANLPTKELLKLDREDRVPNKRWKKRTLKQLDANERIAIVHDYLCIGFKQADVAVHHQVSPLLVSRLTKALRKDYGAIQNLREKET